MKLKKAVKYRYSKVFKLCAVFYLLMLELAIGSVLLKFITKTDISLEEIFPFIMLGFVFIVGMISYSSELKMLIQNGFSRQTVHKSFLCLLPVNMLFAAVSVISDYVFFRINKTMFSDLTYSCSHYFGISLKLPESIAAKMLVDMIIVTFVYFAAMSFGYMLGAISKSMKPFVKFVFGAILVALAALVVAVVSYSPDSIIFENTVIFIRTFFLGTYMVSRGNAVNFCTALLVLGLVFVSVAHLIIGRATVKKGAEKQ